MKILRIEKKKACFFYKFISILANETKSHNLVTKKNTFLWFLVFMCEKLILDYIINTKMSNFACKIVFYKVYILAQKQICSQKKGISILFTSIFFVYTKKTYHTIFIKKILWWAFLIKKIKSFFLWPECLKRGNKNQIGH